MSLFITLFIIIALLAVMDYYSHHNIGLFIAAVILAVTAGIRYNVGYDYESYYWYYVAKQGSFEVGYEFLNKLGHFFHLGVFQFQLFYSFLTIGLLVYFIYKNVKPGIGGLGMLYYFSRFYWVRDLGQIRSALASVICLYSIKYIREERPIPFLIVICIAGSIHRGAFIFIAAYFIANIFNKKIKLNKAIFYIGTAFIVGIILKHFPALVQKMTNSSAYSTASQYTANSSGSFLTVVMQIVVVILYIIVRKRYANVAENKFMDTIMNVYFTGLLVALACIGYRTLGYRLDTILNTSEMILVPYIIDKFCDNKTVSTIVNIIACAVVLYMIMFIDGSYLNFVPFNTIFSSIK